MCHTVLLGSWNIALMGSSPACHQVPQTRTCHCGGFEGSWLAWSALRGGSWAPPGSSHEDFYWLWREPSGWYHILIEQDETGVFTYLKKNRVSFNALTLAHLCRCTWHGKGCLCPARCPPLAWKTADCPVWAEGWWSPAEPRHSLGRVAGRPEGCALSGSPQVLPPPVCHTVQPGESDKCQGFSTGGFSSWVSSISILSRMNWKHIFVMV